MEATEGMVAGIKVPPETCATCKHLYDPFFGSVCENCEKDSLTGGMNHWELKEERKDNK